VYATGAAGSFHTQRLQCLATSVSDVMYWAVLGFSSEMFSSAISMNGPAFASSASAATIVIAGASATFRIRSTFASV
jgi:hypothetical protein